MNNSIFEKKVSDIKKDRKDETLENFNDNEKEERLMKNSIILDQTKPFEELILKYKCALKEVKTKFEVLDEEFSVRHNRNPVEHIETRIKKPLSIIEKLERKGFEVSLASIKNNLNDVAGIRIICSFIDDIYFLKRTFEKQDDIRIIEVKDYIEDPKDNGYRSLHLIIEVPIFLSDVKENIRVEIQLRTIAMDFWASLDHELKYKKSLKNPKIIYDKLKKCADNIAQMDEEMYEIRQQLDAGDI